MAISEKDLTMPDPSKVLQAFFLLSAVTLLFINSLPALRIRFIAYGARTAPSKDILPNRLNKRVQETLQTRHKSSSEVWKQVLDSLATIQVPHGYFQHFYIVSVLSSVFWGIQFVTKGSIMERISQSARPHDLSKSMSIDQIALTWSLISIQGVRRLFESSLITKSSGSKMWFVHWLLGIVFYLAVSFAIWIEGAAAMTFTHSPASSITWSAPSLKTMTAIPIFILSSGIQYDCHAYLASLPKYTLPMHPIFQVLICPHYTAECLIYLSLAVISAPKGAIINRTVFAALIFVSTNLAVSASMSKEWYENKFGKEAVAQRWKIIPSLY